MAGKFTIEVPINVKGKSGKDIGEKIAEAFSKKTGSLMKSIGIGGAAGAVAGGGSMKGIGKMAGVLGLILIALDSMMFIIKPVIDLFKIILMLLFLPLIPILKPVLIGLATFIKWYAPIARRAMIAVEKMVAVIGTGVSWIWGNVLGPIFKELWRQFTIGFRIIREIGPWLWNNILVPGFEILIGIGKFLWDFIIFQFQILLGIGTWLWDNIIVKGFNFLLNAGSMIWNIISPPFSWLAGKIRSLWNTFKNIGGSVSRFIRGGRNDDFISRPGQGISQFNPQDTIIGIKDPSRLGTTIININNPSVRNESDIKRLANEVSRVLQRQISGRIAQ